MEDDAHLADEEGILRLANQFGWLFEYQFGLVGDIWHGESAKKWKIMIEFLHSAVELWEAKPKTLCTWIELTGAEANAAYRGPLGFQDITTPGTLIRAAMEVLRTTR